MFFIFSSTLDLYILESFYHGFTTPKDFIAGMKSCLGSCVLLVRHSVKNCQKCDITAYLRNPKDFFSLVIVQTNTRKKCLRTIRSQGLKNLFIPVLNCNDVKIYKKEESKQCTDIIAL